MANLEYMKYGTNQSNKNRVVFKYLPDLLFEWDENVKKKELEFPDLPCLGKQDEFSALWKHQASHLEIYTVKHI